jgi:hypothetical protein
MRWRHAAEPLAAKKKASALSSRSEFYQGDPGERAAVQSRLAQLRGSLTMHRSDRSGCEADHNRCIFLVPRRFFLRAAEALDSPHKTGPSRTTVSLTAGKGLAPSARPMLSLPEY